MTYLGNDKYEIHFDSGTPTVILTEGDIDEIVVDCAYVDDLKDDLEIANDELNELIKCVNQLDELIKRFEVIKVDTTKKKRHKLMKKLIKEFKIKLDDGD